MDSRISNRFSLFIQQIAESKLFTGFFSKMNLAKSLVVAGIILRAILFFTNQGLREDEGNLAIDILNTPISSLLQPFENGQVAPPLFLLVEKISLLIFGTNEFAIRALAFISSCIALILFYKFMKAHTNSYITTMSVAFMAINRWIIFSAVAVKQYSGDLLINVLLFYILFSKTEFIKSNRFILLGLIGAIAIWFSHVSIFILFTIGVFSLFSFSKNAFSENKKIIMAWLVWGVSFVILYFKTIMNNPNQGLMQEYWMDHFMPLLPVSLKDLTWFPIHFRDMISYSLGFSNKNFLLWIPYGYCFLSGILFCIKQREHRFFLWLLFPMLIHLVVSGLGLYAFYGRLILYLTFPIFVFMGIGIYYTLQYILTFFSFKYANNLVVYLLIMLLSVVGLIDFPYTTEDIKKSLSVVKANIEPGDKVYAYFPTIGAIDFYKEKYLLFNTDIYYGKASRKNYANYDEQLKKLSGRVWFVFSHIYKDPSGLAEDEYIVSVAEKRGKVLLKSTSYQASVYLVDMKPIE